MTFEPTFRDVIDLAQLLVPAALGLATYWFRQLNSTIEAMSERIAGVEDELRKMNGRLLRLEEWRVIHERLCDQRDERVDQALLELRRIYGSGVHP